jgi:hypothetical protein
MSDVTYVGAAEMAKELRAFLKNQFPRTRFSVRSKSYAGGSSVRVIWTDGPTVGLVEHELGRAGFNGKGFDGMTDSSYLVTSKRNGKQVRYTPYLFCERERSDAFLLWVYHEVCARYGLEPLAGEPGDDGRQPIGNCSDTVSELVYRHAANRTYPAFLDHDELGRELEAAREAGDGRALRNRAPLRLLA